MNVKVIAILAIVAIIIVALISNSQWYQNYSQQG